MQKEKFYQIMTNIFKNMLFISTLTLLLPFFQKEPTIASISYLIFVISISVVINLYLLFNKDTFFITTILMAVFGYMSIVSIVLLIKPDLIKFFTEFDLLFKILSVIFVLTIRYFLRKKDLLFPIFFYLIGYKNNKPPLS